MMRRWRREELKTKKWREVKRRYISFFPGLQSKEEWERGSFFTSLHTAKAKKPKQEAEQSIWNGAFAHIHQLIENTHTHTLLTASSPSTKVNPAYLIKFPIRLPFLYVLIGSLHAIHLLIGCWCAEDCHFNWRRTVYYNPASTFHSLRMLHSAVSPYAKRSLIPLPPISFPLIFLIFFQSKTLPFSMPKCELETDRERVIFAPFDASFLQSQMSTGF